MDEDDVQQGLADAAVMAHNMHNYGTIDVPADVARNLRRLQYALLVARQRAKAAGFGYEIDDAISELLNFVEFEMDEKGVEYNER